MCAHGGGRDAPKGHSEKGLTEIQTLLDDQGNGTNEDNKGADDGNRLGDVRDVGLDDFKGHECEGQMQKSR